MGARVPSICGPSGDDPGAQLSQNSALTLLRWSMTEEGNRQFSRRYNSISSTVSS
jgi:hypothetical protein